jgi:hypothetical protein
MPITRGATPALAIATTRALGLGPCLAAAASSASSNAHAPSLTPEASPAVTLPSGRTTPLSLASASRLVSRGCSSWVTTWASPFFFGIVTGTISASKKPLICAATADHRRTALLGLFKRRRARQWPALSREIELAVESVNTVGYCAASWQAEVVALATPLPTSEACYALNVSVSTAESSDEVAAALAAPLLGLKREILRLLALRSEG